MAADKKRNAHILVKLFVAFHLLSIIAWSLPNPPKSVAQGVVEPQGTMKVLAWNYSAFKDRNPDTLDSTPGKLGVIRRNNPVVFYNLSLGMWQYWDMFAPDPSSIDIWGDAEVVYRDGTTKRWQYPRIYDLPILQKYPMERYRKFYERASDPQYSYLFPYFAYRVAYLNWTDPNNPPVEVSLYQHRMAIPAMGQPKPKEYAVHKYWEQQIVLSKLQEMKEEGWTERSRLPGL